MGNDTPAELHIVLRIGPALDQGLARGDPLGTEGELLLLDFGGHGANLAVGSLRLQSRGLR